MKPSKVKCGSSIKGFTLIEILVVIAVIAVLASLLLPGASLLRRGARNVQCLNSLRTHGLAMNAFLDDNNQTFPIANTSTDNWVFQTYKYAGGILYSIRSGGASKSPYICPEAVLSEPSAGGGNACTYGMNDQFSQLNRNRVRQPSRTALLADGYFFKPSASWILQINAGILPALVHQKAANVLFADFHIESVKQIPQSSMDVFWNPGQ
jgi:prepilin-type N-terminal cleavage/methylation domain-containing protein/prepilin-type processing-associated H-X9-DG protein